MLVLDQRYYEVKTQRHQIHSDMTELSVQFLAQYMCHSTGPVLLCNLLIKLASVSWKLSTTPTHPYEITRGLKKPTRYQQKRLKQSLTNGCHHNGYIHVLYCVLCRRVVVYAVAYCDSCPLLKLGVFVRTFKYTCSIVFELNKLLLSLQMCANTDDSSFFLSRRKTCKKEHNKHRHLVFVVFDLR